MRLCCCFTLTTTLKQRHLHFHGKLMKKKDFKKKVGMKERKRGEVSKVEFKSRKHPEILKK